MARPNGKACRHPAIAFYHHLSKPAKADEPRICEELVKNCNLWYSQEEYRALLGALAKRREEEVKTVGRRWPRAALVRARTTTQFVIGSSFGRLWDVGFQLHPLYGIPYIPASGIRGAVHHWAQDAGYGDATQWFAEEQQSRFWVSDGFPKPGGKLLREGILTKHHPGYYEEQNPTPPADYDEPVPVTFLAVPAGVEFEFIVAMGEARPGEDGDPLANAQALLSETLSLAGLGAKTRKGYGLFQKL